MQSALTTYKEAVSELINAVNALDQAHSMLNDIGWDQYISTQTWGRHVSLLDAVAMTDKLLFDAQNATCPECAKPLAESEDCLSGCCPDLVGHVNG
jgi:hypothetical protein